MNILFLHNRYQQKGGEDLVFEAEYSLLKQHNQLVDKVEFSNDTINSFQDRLKVGIFGVYNLFSTKIIKDKIKKFSPDIIHVHNFFPLISPSVFYVAKKYNIPTVMTLHNFRLICPKAILFHRGNICEKCINRIFPYPALMNKCYRDSFIQTMPLVLMIGIHKVLNTWSKKVDKFIALTEFQKNKFLKANIQIPSEKIIIKPNFSIDYGDGFRKRDDFFLYVGRLSEEKGIKTLLEAQKHGNFNLKIVGKGPLEEKVLTYAKERGNIEYLGFKDRSYIIKLIKKTKALIFPSEWYEGFPMVIIEAFSTGTPVISSNIGSQASIVKNGKNGLHFTTGNPIDLAEKVKLFLNRDMNFLYRNARNEYLALYTPEQNYNQLMNIYKGVIDASKKENHKY